MSTCTSWVVPVVLLRLIIRVIIATSYIDFFESVELSPFGLNVSLILCVTECSIQCHADSAYEEYAQIRSLHTNTSMICASAYEHFNDMRLDLHMNTLNDMCLHILHAMLF